jgi:hypothetical protein
MDDERMPHQVMDLPDGSGQLVVHDWTSTKATRFPNLVRVDKTGAVVWTAELPQQPIPDCFTHVSTDGETISANTFSGYLVTLDPKTGKILTSQFTK